MNIAQIDSFGRVIGSSTLYDPPATLPTGMFLLPNGVSQAQAFGYAYNTQSQAFEHVGAAPSPHQYWDFGANEWTDSRTLQELKDAAWNRIKASRESAIDAPLATPYGTFDCGPKDRTNITDAVLLLQTLAAVGTPTTIDFTLADNTTVTLTTAEMVTVGLLLGQKVQAAHGIARQLRSEIDAATTKEQLDAIVW